MKVILLGAGKLANHLGPAFAKSGAEVLAIYNRHVASAKKLAKDLGSNTMATDQLSELPSGADLYVLAVSDNAIAEVAKKLKSVHGPDIFVVHSSGATPSTVLADFFSKYGVFYPLQSFSEGREIDFSAVPICIHASNSLLMEQLTAFAKKISGKVYEVNDEQRSQLHVAAVFANNFVNHVLGISHQILEEADLPKSILFKLISETIQKLETGDAKSMQTGPAIRGDKGTMDRHEKWLKDYPDALDVYQLISSKIIKLTN
jgi:predicted short-subunit dehydrogenase-like oxidoreductase (DUF2520 family)